MFIMTVVNQESGITETRRLASRPEIYRQVATWKNPEALNVVVTDDRDEIIGMKNFGQRRMCYSRF